MPDVLRLVTWSPGGRPVVVRDLENGSTFQKVRDSFAIAAPAKKQQMAASGRRYGGSRQVGEAHDNGAIAWSALVMGATADAALGNVEGLIADWEVALGGRYIEFRPDGATRSVFFEVRATAEWTWKYQWAQFAGAQSSIVECKIPVAPLALLAPMDVLDDFSVDSSSDYTFDSGASAQVAITGGQLTALSSLTVEKRMVHTARGYTVLDAQGTAKGVPGATIASYKLGVELRRSASDTYLEVYVDDNATNSRLRIDKVIAGARTNLATINLAARVVAGTAFWVRGRVEGNVVYAEHFTTIPTPMGAPTTATSYTLTAAEQAALPAGTGGISWIPQHAAATVDDFCYLPYTYRSLTLPEYVALGGPIPGTADALADISITHAGGAAAPIWALIGWAERPPAYNLVWNGDFEENTDGWQTTAVTGVQAAAGTSIARDTTAVRTKFGSANMQIVTPATVGAGANGPLYRRFRKGVTYTATLWASAAASTTAMVLKLGVNGDLATSSATALSGGIVQWTVTWTPTADREVATLSFQTNAATATTCNVDGICVFEGTVAPTLGRHAEGAGAVPPFGIIEAESLDGGDISGWSLLTPHAGARLNYSLADASVSGAETYTAGWWIDPALLVADDFTSGEIDIEFWSRANMNAAVVSPRAVLSARPEWGTAFGAERFTAEFGAAGKLLPKGTGAQWRMSRLGSITFPVDTSRPARWKLWLTLTTAAGSAGNLALDGLIAVPARKRICGASGKPNDSSYPDFIASTAETTRTITSQLRGLVAKPPFPAQPTAGALGGAAIELPAGNTDLLLKLSTLVPDDPTADATDEQLSHAATVHVAVTPRVNLARGF